MSEYYRDLIERGVSELAPLMLDRNYEGLDGVLDKYVNELTEYGMTNEYGAIDKTIKEIKVGAIYRAWHQRNGDTG